MPLVVGSGIAGLYVALRCRELGLRPTLVTKSRLEESNTRYAQGGIAAAIAPDDSVSLHHRDTVKAGYGLADTGAARILSSEAPARIADLVRFGVPFDTVDGRIALGREAAHSRSRILHAGGDATGLSIEETLRARVLSEGIETRERTVLRRLATSPGRGLTATFTLDDGSGREEVGGRPVVLATGGAGSLFRHSSNPSIATGDGVAVAFRAGARLTDMEFIQFHPTTFFRVGAPRFLITEALRGEGALVVNEDGERFLPRYHPDAELAPRDVVSRAIHAEMSRTKTDHVYLDATRIPRDQLFTRFPTVCRFLSAFALDPSRDRIPVTPAAHYMVGGVTTDHEGRTTLPGLLACGEVASTGVHGANRLASNSLLEGLVFGERVVRQLLHPSGGGPAPSEHSLRVRLPAPRSGAREGPGGIETVRTVLWESVGIVRDAVGLRTAVGTLERLQSRSDPSTSGELPEPWANAALTAGVIARAALAREESRGAHFRSDFPETLPSWRWRLSLELDPA